jgi:MFS family permease
MQAITLRDQTHAARLLFRENYIYRRYLLTRLVLAAADIATPFYAIFATRILGAAPEIVGAYIGISTTASLLMNPLLSRLSDKRGHRLVLNIAALGALVMPLTALAFTALPPGPGLGLPFGILFVAAGISRTSANIAFPSYLLEISPGAERPLYVGLTNTLLGVATFIPVIGGILLDVAGFGVVLWLTTFLSAIGFWLARGMVEPRTTRANLPTSSL